MTVVGIIPARMAASRFPGKPLAPLCGRPMLEHVYWRATRARCVTTVYVATPDREIQDAAGRFGAPVIMTSAAHARAVDRVAEAASQVSADIVITIQGDEPLMQPASLDLLGDAMTADSAIVCANLVNPITRDEDFRDPNQIKVVCDRRNNVLYMSRQAIPSAAGPDGRLRQMGLIGFRRDFLATFAALPPAPLEAAESVDILRALEHGFTVRAVFSPYESFGVDTREGLRAAEARLAGDPLTAALLGARAVKTE